MSAALAQQILTAARAKSTHLACAESCTGGMIAAALTDVAGSSDAFDCGFITYSNSAKVDLLGIEPQTLVDFGAVSEQIAREMAEGALTKSAATLAVATTGIAGPGPSGRKPEGRVCFAIAREGQPTRTETVEFGAKGRAGVRQLATNHALSLILAAI